MADEQPQQTRVLLLNGQTIILQGDASDNALSEINADLLQQALQEATGGAESVEETRAEEEYQPPAATENAATNAGNNNVVAIFQGDQGETHTVQLTMEQAEALGLHFMSDEPEKVTSTPDLPPNVAPQQMTMSNEGSQLVYTDNASQAEETKPLFGSCVNTDSSLTNIQSASLQGDANSTSTLQHNIGELSSLSEVVGSYMGDSNNITLIPQFVNGQMTYTVKLNEQTANSLQNQEFPSIESEDDTDPETVVETKQKLPLLAPALPANMHGTNTSTPATSVSSIRINNIPTMMNTLTPIVPTLTQANTNTFVAPKSLLPTLPTVTSIDKSTKATYVVVPSPCSTVSPSSTSASAATVTPLSIKGSPLLRAINRSGISVPPPLQPTKMTSAIAVSTSSHTPSTTATLTGIPLMNSNINITRTPAAGSSLLQQSVSTSLTGGGMIRVVAGGTTTRMVQAPTTNGPKFTNILTPSGRLVATTSTQPTQQKILAVNSTASSTKTTPVATTAVSTTVVTEPLQSSAVQSAAARLNINSTKPLGSSENPIQLVQHGQTFHSVQALSQEQLRQIATVLQQQHLDSAPRTKNVLYDAETNTRIIYRVVYPEDLDLREPSSPSEKQVNSGVAISGRGRGRRGRPPKTAVRPVGRGGSIQDTSSPSMGRKITGHVMDIDLDEDRLVDDSGKVNAGAIPVQPASLKHRLFSDPLLIGSNSNPGRPFSRPELLSSFLSLVPSANEEGSRNGERKKQVARTRSGRLSRPPRHMVKDYKRLHHLDFADADLDDSDGGYSDYQMSDREVEEQESVPNTGTPPPATSLAGTLANQEEPTAAPVGTTSLLPGLQTSKRKISSHFRCPTCQKVYLGHSRMARHFDMFPEHGSIDQMRTNTPAAPSSPMPLPDSTQGKVGIGSTLNGIVRPSGGRRRGKRRGPWAYMTPEARSERRKIKLREALGTCEASELSEVAGPAVAGAMSLWELLLLRVETVRTEESLMSTLCEELRALLEKVQSVAGEVLQPVSCGDPSSKEEQIELQDEVLCNALGLPSGKYQIVDDHLLTRKAQCGFDIKLEPAMKRMKSEESSIKVEVKQDIKPSCPEVLSALALESRPTTVANTNTTAITSAVTSTITSTESPNSHPPSPTKLSPDCDQIKMLQDNSPDREEETVKEGTEMIEPKPISDQEDEHPFLLPPTSEMCVDELSHEPVGGEGEHHGTETVDDIVNERLKNLTGFSVGVPENVPTQQVSQVVSQFPEQHNTADTEVPTFDPEMALAAMGEGDQPDGRTSLTEFAPEIALAAMGEGERDPEENRAQHSAFNSSVPPVFESMKSIQEDVPAVTCSMPSNEESKLPELNSSSSSSGEVFSNMSLSSIETSQTENPAENKDVTFTTSMLTNSENTFITSLAVGATSIGKAEAGSDPSVSNFDPEIALAAMGEGDPTEGPPQMHSESTFDPEMALASMGEGVSSGPSSQDFPQQRDSSASESAFQLSAMDVSLDESGPELDFDALSAEFTRTTRHS